MTADADPHAVAHAAGRANRLPIEETERLVAADRVTGAAVFDRDGRRVGSVQTFMVDKATGKVAYAVLSLGGLLDAEERYHPLPWQSLSYDPDRGGFVLPASRQELEAGPSYPPAEPPWGDDTFGRGVYDYYKVPWYL
ncbi:PRC-barrel domain-containing protein [Alsobacter sp. R-9]